MVDEPTARRLRSLDFTNLFIAPLAAIATVLVVCLSVFLRPRSEDRSLVWAFLSSLLLGAVVTQPWYFTSQRALTDGLIALLILSTFGFAVGAFVALVIVKGGRALKDLFKRRS